LRQLTLGETYIAPDTEEIDFSLDCKSSKLDAVEGLIADLVGEQVVIATDSAKFARVVAARLGGFAWTGDKKQVEREEAKQKFIAGQLRIIVATQAAISEGTDGLQRACRVLIELSQSDSPILNQQMVGRLNRTGQEKRVIVYKIMARNTLDDPQAETLLGKELQMRASMLKNSNS
jgi:superfamily II DNA or RNA helicase